MPRLASLVLTAGLLTTLFTTAACGSDDSEAAPGTGGATTTASPSEDAPSSTPTPTVEPATGQLLEMPHASVRVPEGWTVQAKLVPTMESAKHDDSSSGISLGEIQKFASPNASAQQLGQAWHRTNPYPRDPKVLPVFELDDVDVYHVAGRLDAYKWVEEFGAVVDGQLVTLRFDFDPELSRRTQQQEIVDSVLATFRWDD